MHSSLGFGIAYNRIYGFPNLSVPQFSRDMPNGKIYQKIWRWGESNPRPDGPEPNLYRLSFILILKAYMG